MMMSPLSHRHNAPDFYVGDEAISKQSILNLKYPVERGIVTDWKAMEQVWQHAIYKVLDGAESAEECAVLVTESPLNPKANREKITEVWFDKLGASDIYIATQAVLSLYGSKSYTASFNTGISLDSGGGVTHIVPVYEGHVLPHAVKRLELGGNDLAEYTDGQTTLCQDGQHRCVQPLFKPTLLRYDDVTLVGIHKLTYELIMECDVDIHKDLCSNIVLSGGNTIFPGMADRLQKEVQALFPPTMRVKAFAPPEPGESAWVGGSMLCSSQFDRLVPGRLESFVHHDEYMETGPSIVHRKCF
jgi:actin